MDAFEMFYIDVMGHDCTDIVIIQGDFGCPSGAV